MKTVTRAACRGCHGGCMYLLTVEDGRLVKAVPDPEGPLNQGRGGVKGMSIVEQVYHPDRLTTPLRRVGERGSGKWESVSWDEALDEIAEKMGAIRDTYGPEALAIISGTGRHHLPYFFRLGNAIGTPNFSSAGAPICLGPRRTAAIMTAGLFAGVDYYGSKRPGGILVWGANPAISGAVVHQGRGPGGDPHCGHRPQTHRAGQAGQALAAGPAGHRRRPGPGHPESAVFRGSL